MKKVLLLLFLGGAFALYWHSTHAALDPVLLRRATQEYTARRGSLGNQKVLTIIDYRLSIFQPRLFVYDVETRQLKMSCRVSHALKSGLFYASDFSNAVGSEKSSFGIFRTDLNSYEGKFGRALRVDGLSKNLNDNARTRAVVFHPDPGYRFSNGCFMTSATMNNRLISLIQGGSLVVVYK